MFSLQKRFYYALDLPLIDWVYLNSFIFDFIIPTFLFDVFRLPNRQRNIKIRPSFFILFVQIAQKG